jgi:hypothetical protein
VSTSSSLPSFIPSTAPPFIIIIIFIIIAITIITQGWYKKPTNDLSTSAVDSMSAK